MPAVTLDAYPSWRRVLLNTVLYWLVLVRVTLVHSLQGREAITHTQHLLKIYEAPRGSPSVELLTEV